MSSEVPKIFNMSLFLNANFMAKSDYMMRVILGQLEHDPGYDPGYDPYESENLDNTKCTYPIY